jgi:hypothetical protein
VANTRQQIVQALTNLLNENFDGQTSPYTTNIYENAKNKQIFWDEVKDYPTICVYSGGETREYLPGDFKWAFLTVNIRVYVNDEDAKDRIEEIFEDIEYLLDNNNNLTVDGNDLSTDIRILSLSDDEGLLNPLGVGEIVLEVRYEV